VASLKSDAKNHATFGMVIAESRHTSRGVTLRQALAGITDSQRPHLRSARLSESQRPGAAGPGHDRGQIFDSRVQLLTSQPAQRGPFSDGELDARQRGEQEVEVPLCQRRY
jgi:hypothetical protein